MGFYREVDQRTWGDRKFRALSDDGKMLWFYLLTSPEALPVPGCIVAGQAGLAEALGWPVDRFAAAFGELADQGMAKADWSARFVWLPRGIRHRPPANPNIVKNWLEYLDGITECDLLDEALEALWNHLQARGGRFPAPFSERFPERFGKPFQEPSLERSTKRYAKQDRDRDRDREREGESEGDAVAPPGPPGDDPGDPPWDQEPDEPTSGGEVEGPEARKDRVVWFIESWNEATGGAISAGRIPDKRRQAIRKALVRHPDPEFWDQAVAKVLELRGALKVLGESDGWLDFDWVLKTTKGQVLPNADRLVAGHFDFKLQAAATMRPPPAPPSGRTSRYL